MKRVVLTGATGFVGANLTHRLLRDGHEVHLLVRHKHQAWRLDDIREACEFHEVDLANRHALKVLLGVVQPDWVFHLAAYGAYPAQTGVDRMVATNVLGSIALLDVCAGIGIESFVQTGSSSEYGYKSHPATEYEALEPNSHYAITKAAATHYCQFTARQQNIHAVTVRLYSVYGPYEEPARLVPTLIVYGMAGRLPPLVRPDTARDFVYVDDAVEAMIQVAKRSALPRGCVFNICTGKQNTVETIVSIVRSVLELEAQPVWATMPQRAWDTNSWVGSPAALEQHVGWRATTSLQAGIEKTVAWFRARPETLAFYVGQLNSGSRP